MIVFIAGTGPDAGKTVAAAAMARLLSRRGRRVAYLKPIETGLRPRVSGDAAFVRAAGAVATAEGLRFEQALPPAVCAELQDEPIDLDWLVDLARARAAAVDVLIVEGCGGLAEPIRGPRTMADLAAALCSRVVIAAPVRGGALGPLRLTLDAAAARDLDVAGIVLGAWPISPSPAERVMLRRFERMAPVLGVVPFESGLDTGRCEERVIDLVAGPGAAEALAGW